MSSPVKHSAKAAGLGRGRPEYRLLGQLPAEIELGWFERCFPNWVGWFVRMESRALFLPASCLESARRGHNCTRVEPCEVLPFHRKKKKVLPFLSVFVLNLYPASTVPCLFLLGVTASRKRRHEVDAHTTSRAARATSTLTRPTLSVYQCVSRRDILETLKIEFWTQLKFQDGRYILENNDILEDVSWKKIYFGDEK
jgi:hypothetical protein